MIHCNFQMGESGNQGALMQGLENERCEEIMQNKIMMSLGWLITLMIILSGCGGSGSLDETASISLIADSTTTYADGVSSVSITASVADSSGVPIPAYSDVRFQTNNGRFRNGSQTYSVTTKDASGVVVASLIAPDAPGFAEVICESSGVTQSIRIDFLHYDNPGEVAPEGFGLSVEYHNLSGLWLAGLENTVWAHLGDAGGRAVQDGIPVYFSTYNTGGFFDPDMAVTGGAIDDATLHGAGTASSTLYTTPDPSPPQGMVSVTAETDGGPTTRITSIAVTPSPDSHILYAGTNGGGIYKSLDSGRSWQNISRSTETAGQNWIDPYISGNSAIAIDPDDYNTVYVGTGYLGEGNLFRSLDGGLNWNSNDVEEWNGLYNTNTAVLSVLCDDGGSDYVWMGTDGQGVLYSEDGETFQPSGGTVTVNSSFGEDVIDDPMVGYSAQSEVWTLTCIVPDATVNSPLVYTDIDPVEMEENDYAQPPVLTASNPDTDGRIESITTSATTKTEQWSATYVLEDIEVHNLETAENKGTIVDVNPKISPISGGSGMDMVVTSPSYVSPGVAYEHWTLTCIYVDINANQLLDQAGAIFRVESSVVGQIRDANLGQAYTSERIDFTIIPGQSPFIVGDVIEFDTIQTAYWQVEGTLSGMQEKVAYIGNSYTSDNKEVGFKIEAGRTAFSDGDVFTFMTYEAKPAYWIVEGSRSGMQAAIAQTDRIYTSDNGEITFTIMEEGNIFRDGDEITLDVTVNKLSHGWRVTDFVKVPETHGASAELYAATTTGVYKSLNGGRTWDGIGRFTGDSITALVLHRADNGEDVLYAGTQNAGVWGSVDSGITWTQYVGDLGQGTTVKDVALDRYNHRLYALSWYGPKESATGQLFVMDLDGENRVTGTASWQQSSEGLTGSALYAVALDNADLGRELYVGGEGIAFHYAGSGLAAGMLPQWMDGTQGLSNRVMARIPVLFSGEAVLSYDLIQYDDLVFLTVYIQDYNGNPPIAGSTYSASFHSESAGQDYTWDDFTYPDTYSYRGTFRDPGNGLTNNPYQYVTLVGSGDEITLTYNPLCNEGEDRQAGCSGGSEQTYTISF